MKTVNYFFYSLLICCSSTEAGFISPIQTNSFDKETVPTNSYRETYGPIQQHVTVNYPTPVLPTKKFIKAEEFHFDLKGLNREQIRNFSKNARNMPTSTKEYEIQNRAKTIFEKYKYAFITPKHQKTRTDTKITLDVAIKQNIFSENIISPLQEKRFAALLNLFEEGNYLWSILEFFNISELDKNEDPYRDLLLAGFASAKIKWEHLSLAAFQGALERKIEKNPAYTVRFWEEIGKLKNKQLINLITLKMTDSWKIIPNNKAYDAALLSYTKTHYFNKDKSFLEKISEKFSENSREKENAELLNAIGVKNKTLLEKLSLSKWPEVQNNAKIHLARLLVMDKSFESAYQLYKSIPKNDHNLLSVLTELAYLENKLGKHQESIGKSVGLRSDFFLYGFNPDIYFIESKSRLQICDFGGAKNSLEEFVKTYTPEKNRIRELLAEPKNLLYHQLLTSFKEKNGKRIDHYLLQQADFLKTQSFINSYNDEKIAIAKTIKFQKDLNLDKLHSILEKYHTKNTSILLENLQSGLIKELKYAEKRLTLLTNEKEILTADILADASQEFHLQSAHNFNNKQLELAATVDPDKIIWPHENEFWEDELSDLRSNIPSKCVKNLELANAK